MSAIVGIWVVIILIRWVLPMVIGMFSKNSPVREEWGRRGKVEGHRGPNVRSFKGRAGRREWWLTTLGNTIVSSFVGAVPTIGVALTLPWIIAGLAVNARRLHDLSLSAWLQLIPMVFGAVAVFAFYYLGGPENPPQADFSLATPASMLTIFGAVTGVLYLIFYVAIGFWPGRDGPNVYGEADVRA